MEENVWDGRDVGFLQGRFYGGYLGNYLVNCLGERFFGFTGDSSFAGSSSFAGGSSISLDALKLCDCPVIVIRCGEKPGIRYGRGDSFSCAIRCSYAT